MGRVIRFPDPEHRSRQADAAFPRDPGDSAIIIVLPVIRIERYEPHRWRRSKLEKRKSR